MQVLLHLNWQVLEHCWLPPLALNSYAALLLPLCHQLFLVPSESKPARN
jgi:hypothetical protein